MAADHLGDLHEQVRGAPRCGASTGRCACDGAGSAKWRTATSRRRRHRRPHGQLGQQRDPDARGDHLAQRLEARRPEVPPLGRAGERAHLERLVAKAVALLEQQHPLVRRARPVDGADGRWRAGARSAAPARSPRRRAARRASPSSRMGRATTPASSWPSRSRSSTTSVFSSESSSSSFGNRSWIAGTTWGSRYGASVGNSPMRRVADSGSAARLAMAWMSSTSSEDRPCRADDLLAGRR